MNLFYILVIGFLLELVDCNHFSWRSITTVNTLVDAETRAYQMSSDGTTHVIWGSYGRSTILLYRTITPNGTIEDKARLNISYVCDHLFYATLQVSDDGYHLLVAFDGTVKSNARDEYRKSLFIESVDGGLIWSEPILVRGAVNDKISRAMPSIFLEKDTKRVFIAYSKGDFTRSEGNFSIEICKREPGEKSFSLLTEIPQAGVAFYPRFVQTRDSSGRYFHLLVRNSDGELIHYRSIDLKTWTGGLTIDNMGKNTYFSVTTDDKISQGALYTQYGDKNMKEIVAWSRDNGMSFERLNMAGNTQGDRKGDGTLINICGEATRPLLFVAYRAGTEGAYIKFTDLGNKRFLDIPYPFQDFPTPNINFDVLACRCERREYYITFLASAAYLNIAKIAHGTLVFV